MNLTCTTLCDSPTQEIRSNPPLGYDPQDAANQFLAVAKAEILAAKGTWTPTDASTHLLRTSLTSLTSGGTVSSAIPAQASVVIEELPCDALSSDVSHGCEAEEPVGGQERAAAAALALPLFDEWVVHDPGAKDASLSRLAEAVHRHFPAVVSREFVWGYGRALWDPEVGLGCGSVG